MEKKNSNLCSWIYPKFFYVKWNAIKIVSWNISLNFINEFGYFYFQYFENYKRIHHCYYFLYYMHYLDHMENLIRIFFYLNYLIFFLNITFYVSYANQFIDVMKNNKILYDIMSMFDQLIFDILYMEII
jgi:hypothetical protein